MTAVDFRVTDLASNLPPWPDASTAYRAERSDTTKAPRAMRASDFGHWTPEGRESLSRILRRVLVANGRRKP